MKRVTINGRSYGLPFLKLLPPLTAARYMELVADVSVNGVQQNLLVATTPLWGRVVVEGAHRALVAEGLGVEVPVTCLGDVSEEDAKQRCLALNLTRRHMTVEEQQQARLGRVARVAAARHQGKSIRAIAELEQVSKTQVHRDLADNGVASPATLVARNGAVWTGHRRKKTRTVGAARAHAMLTRTAAQVRTVLRASGTQRARLEALAEAAGVPFAGTTWPALDVLLAVLRDAATGGTTA